MPLSHIPLVDITEADILALVDSQKDKDRESKRIEYKRELPHADYESKKEFLADVSSFANASGGDIIFGIEEEAGKPVAVRGLGQIDADAEILRLNRNTRHWHTRGPELKLRTQPTKGPEGP